MDGTQPTSPLRVVIIDDSTDIRDVLRLALERDDQYSVVAEAADGETGATLVAEHQPDLVLLDIAMPMMDGLQVLPLIRAEAPGSVVIMLTGLAEEVAAISAVENGAHGFIRKGGGISELLDQIREVLTVRREQRRRTDGA